MAKNIFQMEIEKNTQIESAEELEAEKSHLAEVKEDDIRNQVITEYGFDSEENKEMIDKLVQKEMQYKKSLSSAIGQKRKYRDEYIKLNSSKTKIDEGKINFKPEDLDRHVTEALEKRDLEALDYPDDIKKAISQVSKIENMSIRKAMSDPYVSAKIEAYNKKKEAEDAALGRSDKSGRKQSSDSEIPPNVDFSTKEGRDEYDKWRNARIKAGF